MPRRPFELSLIGQSQKKIRGYFKIFAQSNNITHLRFVGAVFPVTYRGISSTYYFAKFFLANAFCKS